MAKKGILRAMALWLKGSFMGHGLYVLEPSLGLVRNLWVIAVDLYARAARI
jgi:hypothetical protein